MVPQAYSPNVMLQLPVKRLLQYASMNQVTLLHNPPINCMEFLYMYLLQIVAQREHSFPHTCPFQGTWLFLSEQFSEQQTHHKQYLADVLQFIQEDRHKQVVWCNIQKCMHALHLHYPKIKTVSVYNHHNNHGSSTYACHCPKR